MMRGGEEKRGDDMIGEGRGGEARRRKKKSREVKRAKDGGFCFFLLFICVAVF